MRRTFTLLFTTAALASCGGGDDNVPAAGSGGALIPTGSPTGLYHGSTSTGRHVDGVVLENGEYWLMYSTVDNPSLIAGAGQGHVTFAHGAATSTDYRDFNFETGSIANGAASASYIPKESVTGTLTLPSLTETFNAKYDFAYEAFSSLAAVAGDYSGTAAVVGGIEPATVSLSSTGAITGVSRSGCRFLGTASIHSGWVYDISITFTGSPCSNGSNTIVGVAVYDPGSRQLAAAALNGSRTNGVFFMGRK